MSLSRRIRTTIMAGALVAVGVAATFAPLSAYAVDCTCVDSNTCTAREAVECGMQVGAETDADGKIKNGDLEGTAKNIINGVLYVVGLLAVVMVIIGGVQYTTSGGDQAKVTKAKNTILYGVVGLVIAILAYAIVNFVIGRVG